MVQNKSRNYIRWLRFLSAESVPNYLAEQMPIVERGGVKLYSVLKPAGRNFYCNEATLLLRNHYVKRPGDKGCGLVSGPVSDVLDIAYSSWCLAGNEKMDACSSPFTIPMLLLMT